MSHTCHAIEMLLPLQTQPWQWDLHGFTKNPQHDSPKVLRLPRKMKMDTFKSAALATKMQVIFWKPCKSIAPATQNDFRHFCRHMRMSRSAAPATQNDIGTCLETFENERFCSFPNRHGDVTRMPEHEDETGWKLKTSVSCEISWHFQTL